MSNSTSKYSKNNNYDASTSLKSRVPSRNSSNFASTWFCNRSPDRRHLGLVEKLVFSPTSSCHSLSWQPWSTSAFPPFSRPEWRSLIGRRKHAAAAWGRALLPLAKTRPSPLLLLSSFRLACRVERQVPASSAPSRLVCFVLSAAKRTLRLRSARLLPESACFVCPRSLRNAGRRSVEENHAADLRKEV